MEQIYAIVDNELFNKIYNEHNEHNDFKKAHPSYCIVFVDYTDSINFNRYSCPNNVLKIDSLKRLSLLALNNVNSKYASLTVNYFNLMKAFEQTFKNGILQAKQTNKNFNSRCDGPLTTDWPKYITKCLHNKTKFSCKECKIWCVACHKLVYGFNHKLTQPHSTINKND